MSFNVLALESKHSHELECNKVYLCGSRTDSGRIIWGLKKWNGRTLIDLNDDSDLYPQKQKSAANRSYDPDWFTEYLCVPQHMSDNAYLIFELPIQMKDILYVSR